MEPLLLDIRNVCLVTNCSKSTVYRLMKRNEFPPPVASSIKRTLWSRTSIEDWVRKKASALTASATTAAH